MAFCHSLFWSGSVCLITLSSPKGSESEIYRFQRYLFEDTRFPLARCCPDNRYSSFVKFWITQGRLGRFYPTVANQPLYSCHESRFLPVVLIISSLTWRRYGTARTEKSCSILGSGASAFNRSTPVFVSSSTLGRLRPRGSLRSPATCFKLM